MNAIDNKMQLVGGQPKRKAKKTADAASEFYKLGRASAALDKKKEDLTQLNLFTLQQILMLRQAKSELENILSQVYSRQSELEAKMNQATAPPPLPPEVGAPALGGAALPPLPAGAPPVEPSVPPQAAAPQGSIDANSMFG